MSKIIHVVSIILEENGKILLLERSKQNGGGFSFVGGKVDANESATMALIREAKEEADIKLKASDLTLVHTMHRKKKEESAIHFFFHATQWKGKIQNNEPHLCKALTWVELAKLPKQMLPFMRQGLEHWQEKVVYSEWNWTSKAANGLRVSGESFLKNMDW